MMSSLDIGNVPSSRGGCFGHDANEDRRWGRSLPAKFTRGERHRVSYRWTAFLLLLLPLSAWAASSHHPRAGQPALENPGYILALATANRFLHAWQSGDLEAGMVLLSDHFRHSRNPDEIENFFSGDTYRAFEIAHGKGNRGRWRFPVVLLTVEGGRVHRKFSKIVLVNTGKNDWAVDTLP
jgi:hypothetical protein